MSVQRPAHGEGTPIMVDDSTRKHSRSAQRPEMMVALGIFVLLSRVPFIGAGYGADHDAWRVAVAARTISESGSYVASRLPGYPISELAYSHLWRGGATALNGATALLSSISAVIFALIMWRLGGKGYILGGLALAFIPVIYVNSTNSMDYVWALAFILGSTYCVLLSRPVLAGVLLGVATGCRITCFAMVVPLIVLLFASAKERRKVGPVLGLALASVATGVLSFLPVIREYGMGFLGFYRSGVPASASDLVDLGHLYSRLPAAAFKVSLGVWGAVGCLAVMAAVASALHRRVSPGGAGDYAVRQSRTRIVSWWTAVCVYLSLFLLLPDEAGYLIVCLPFALLLFGAYLGELAFKLLCLAIILSSFVFGIHRIEENDIGPATSALAVRFEVLGRPVVLDPVKGSISLDHSTRIERMKYIDRVFLAADSLGRQSVVICGKWLSHIRADWRFANLVDVELVAGLGRDEFLARRRKGYDIYYLHGQVQRLRFGRGYDIREYGARSLIPDAKR